MSDDPEPFIDALKSLLKRRKMTLRRLSELTKIPYRSLQNYFSGESRMPADVLLAICDALGLEVEYLSGHGFRLDRGDLYDAVLTIFRDVLPRLEVGPRNTIKVGTAPVVDRSHVLSLAHVLAARLSEEYTHRRSHSFETRAASGKVRK